MLILFNLCVLFVAHTSEYIISFILFGVRWLFGNKLSVRQQAQQWFKVEQHSKYPNPIYSLSYLFEWVF